MIKSANTLTNNIPMTAANKNPVIHVTGSIIIMKDHETVFNFIADLRNDKLWRKEINYTMMSGKPHIYVQATESSYLSIRTPEHILSLWCIDYIKNERIVYETIPASDLFLKSTRQVNSITPNETEVTYSIAFDKGIVKKGLGFSLPAFIVRFAAKKDMRKYLNALATLLESRAD